VQDDELEMAAQAVDRIKEITVDMGDELDRQLIDL
jgi:hypothetical protein